MEKLQIGVGLCYTIVCIFAQFWQNMQARITYLME